MRVIVSGRTYRAALDPLCTGAHDEGLIATGQRKVGKGYQYSYELDETLLAVMIDRLDAVGLSFLDSDDPETRAEGRACLADRDRLQAYLQ